MRTITLPRTSNNKFPGGNPYCMYFVYPEHGQPVIVKGLWSKVDSYVRCQYNNALVRQTFWCQGKSRGLWSFVGKGRSIVKTVDGKWLVTIHDYCRPEQLRVFKFRRVPHKWVPEFDFKEGL